MIMSKKLFSSILLLLLVVSSCNPTKKYQGYVDACMNHKSILWSNIVDERFEVLCQYKPGELNAILEIGLMNFEREKYDSALFKYENMIAYNLYLSDFFSFPSSEILQDLSSSPTLKLETFLAERLYLLADDDTLSFPIVHVVNEKRDIYENTALVFFEMENKVKVDRWKLYLGVSSVENSIIELSSLNKTQLDKFNAENL